MKPGEAPPQHSDDSLVAGSPSVVEVKRGDVTEKYSYSENSLFSVLHVPQKPRRAALICGSLGWEFTKNYRREVLLARRLAAEGWAVGRFHYRGTGDSGGSFESVTMSGLVEDAISVAELLVRDSALEITAFVGTRVGAVVASEVASTVSSPSLVFWDPVANGDEYVRELRRVRQIWQITGTQRTSHEPEVGAAATALDILGYRLPGELLKELAGKNLGENLATSKPHLLVLRMGQRRQSDDSMIQAIATGGSTGDLAVESIPGTFEWWIKRRSFSCEEANAQTDHLLSRTVEWLASRPSRSGGAHVGCELQDRARISSSRPQRRPPLRATSSRASPVQIRSGEADLSGIFVRPLSGAGPLAALILNCGGYHVPAGPAGLWARVAEELAMEGISSLRLSYTGVADSTGTAEEFDLAQPAIDDLAVGRGFLQELGFTDHLLVGGCFGARTACGGPLTGVAGMALVSLPWHKEKLTDGESRRVQREAMTEHREPASALSDSLDQGVPSWLNQNLVRDMGRIAEAGIPTELIYGYSEPYRMDFEAISDSGHVQVGGRYASAIINVRVLQSGDSMFATEEVVRAVANHGGALARDLMSRRSPHSAAEAAEGTCAADSSRPA